jgi:hypothetical protein
MRLSLLLSLLLCLVGGPAQATGPSTAYVRLFPVAAREGAVLFRTWWEVNTSGGAVFIRTEFGWLVADARGGWEEAPHRVLEPDPSGSGEGPYDELDRMREEFTKPLDWDAPPASVQGLLRKYGFTRENAVAPDAGKGTVTWTAKALCKGKRCGAPCRQHSLRGLRSVARGAAPVEAAFVHSGIALFHNKVEDTESRPAVGARFAESQPGQERVVANLEYHTVAGICRVPQ